LIARGCYINHGTTLLTSFAFTVRAPFRLSIFRYQRPVYDGENAAIPFGGIKTALRCSDAEEHSQEEGYSSFAAEDSHKDLRSQGKTAKCMSRPT
jgi:hypothetical protein